jgi:cobalt-zinc-cadmium efflux system membrane fusion protein
VTPRFPGVVTEIRKRVGDRVEKGEVIAKIESNQSLTVYEMKAAISGTVIERQVALGEYASEQKAAFTIADLTSVWVDLAISRRDLSRIKIGDVILVDSGDGLAPVEAKLSYISPVSNADTQSVLARAVVANDPIRLRPGLFVTARLVLQAKEVPLAVKLSALQTIDSRTVVFVRNGTKFEPRDVELGDRDTENVEVMFGLVEGDVYAAKNSFVIKAELAKGSATHEH